MVRPSLVRYIALASTVTRLFRKNNDFFIVPGANAFVPRPLHRSFVVSNEVPPRHFFIKNLPQNDAWEEEGGTSGEEISFEENLVDNSQEDLWKEFQRWQIQLDKAAESLERKQRSLLRELERSKKVEQTAHRANLLKANLYLFAGTNVRTATVQDWETGETIQLTVDDAYESATAEVDALFAQIRKLKRGAEVLEPLIQEAKISMALLSNLQHDLQRCRNTDGVSVEKDLFQFVQDRILTSKQSIGFQPPQAPSKQPSLRTRTAKPTLGTPASNVRKLTSPAGCVVLVGRNRRGNEYISMKFSKSDDIWMHARGTPGAHVVLPNRRGTLVTDECMQFAANLAAFYSDHRTERRVDVTMTYAKHLSKPRNAPLGAVKTREEVKVLRGKPEEVPEELKAARSVSGLSDEYRAADKAKLRQINKNNVKKMKESKKRAKAKARQEAR